MTKVVQSQNGKEKGLTEIREILHSFCKKYLNDELESYAIKLCENLGRKRKIDILRGKKEIWAASIIYAIARLNFLFDKENEKYITADTICNFFNTNKSTVGNKATQIENACTLTIGAKGYCSTERLFLNLLLLNCALSAMMAVLGVRGSDGGERRTHLEADRAA